MPGPEQEAYDRGRLDGQVDARLAGHDRHFEAINGSLTTMAAELRGLSEATHSIRDQLSASAVTVLANAKAVQDAEAARVARNEQSWTPFQRLLGVLSALSTATAAALGVYVALHH